MLRRGFQERLRRQKQQDLQCPRRMVLRKLPTAPWRNESTSDKRVCSSGLDYNQVRYILRVLCIYGISLVRAILMNEEQAGARHALDRIKTFFLRLPVYGI